MIDAESYIKLCDYFYKFMQEDSSAFKKITDS